MNTESTTKPKCPYCLKPIEGTPAVRTIIDRGWNPMTRKQYVRERRMEFCSKEHGANYQMGCEG